MVILGNVECSITQVFRTDRINLSPFTKDFRVWGTTIESSNTLFQAFWKEGLSFKSRLPVMWRYFLMFSFRYWPSTVCPALKWDPWYCPQRTSCRTWPQPGTPNDTSNLPCLSMMSDQVSFMRCFTLQMFLFDRYFYRRWGYWERGMRKIISHSTQDLGGNPGWTRRQCLSFILWFQLSFVRFAEHSKSLALKEGGECNVMTGPCLVKFHLTGRWHMPVRLRKDLLASWKALHTVKHCPDEQFSGLDELASFMYSNSDSKLRPTPHPCLLLATSLAWSTSVVTESRSNIPSFATKS